MGKLLGSREHILACVRIKGSRKNLKLVTYFGGESGSENFSIVYYPK